MVRSESIIGQKGNYIKIKGVTPSDISAAIGGGIWETPKGKYVIPSVELGAILSKIVDPNHVPEVYRIISQGDGYVNNVTTLRMITNPKLARELVTEVVKSIDDALE